MDDGEDTQGWLGGAAPLALHALTSSPAQGWAGLPPSPTHPSTKREVPHQGPRTLPRLRCAGGVQTGQATGASGAVWAQVTSCKQQPQQEQRPLGEHGDVRGPTWQRCTGLGRRAEVV